MIEKYTKSFKVNFRDVDLRMKLRMSSLVDYMQEIAGEHAYELGLNFFGQEQEVYWIVSRAKMHLEEYPNWEETITMKTYPAGIDKLFAVRRFDIYNEAGKEIGYIIGNYILLDSVTNRPVRPTGLEGPIAKLCYPYEGESLPKLKAPVSVEMEDSRKARYSEVDINGHMNNAHYVRWAIDMMSSEELGRKAVQSIQTNYTTSITEGD
ncbi:MAG: acyl-[acyl-carrier-protein] thioesterase, partial [Cellulosilyticaceae bacterium]